MASHAPGAERRALSNGSTLSFRARSAGVAVRFSNQDSIKRRPCLCPPASPWENCADDQVGAAASDILLHGCIHARTRPGRRFLLADCYHHLSAGEPPENSRLAPVPGIRESRTRRPGFHEDGATSHRRETGHPQGYGPQRHMPRELSDSMGFA